MKGENKMKSETKTARVEIKNLIDTIGIGNILNRHFIEIHSRTGVPYAALQNAMNYYKYRRQ